MPYQPVNKAVRNPWHFYAGGKWVGVPTAGELNLPCGVTKGGGRAACAQGVAAYYARSPRGTATWPKPKHPVAASTPGTLRWDPPGAAAAKPATKAGPLRGLDEMSPVAYWGGLLLVLLIPAGLLFLARRT